jgi:tetratricopeptide (TPR) repeat protein
MAKRGLAIKLFRRVGPEMRRMRWLKAIKILNAEPALVRNDWELSWDLAWCYLNVGQLDLALTNMLRASKLAPRSFGPSFGLGRVYLKRKQYKKAETNYAKSLRITDSYVARLGMALALMKQGKAAEAESVHLKGIKLEPKDIRRYEAYADFLSDVRREDEAQAMYRKARKLRRMFPGKPR